MKKIPISLILFIFLTNLGFSVQKGLAVGKNLIETKSQPFREVQIKEIGRNLYQVEVLANHDIGDSSYWRSNVGKKGIEELENQGLLVVSKSNLETKVQATLTKEEFKRIRIEIFYDPPTKDGFDFFSLNLEDFLEKNENIKLEVEQFDMPPPAIPEFENDIDLKL